MLRAFRSAFLASVPCAFPTLSANSAWMGGGIANQGYGDINVVNSTLADNSAPDGGGGIFNRGILRMTNVTVVRNQSWAALLPHPGGVANKGGTLHFTNTIIAYSGGDGDCANYEGTSHEGTISTSHNN